MKAHGRHFSHFALIALTWFSPATASAQEAQQDASAQRATDHAVEDIVIIAQRRPEMVQKSSLAIEVLGGDQLSRTGPRVQPMKVV